jgi:hypothetical protein
LTSPAGLTGPAAHGQDVALDQPVHARDADGREERTDRRRDEADEQGDRTMIDCSAPE